MIDVSDDAKLRDAAGLSHAPLCRPDSRTAIFRSREWMLCGCNYTCRRCNTLTCARQSKLVGQQRIGSKTRVGIVRPGVDDDFIECEFFA